MPKKRQVDRGDRNIELTTEEVAAARVIVIDWLNEGLMRPPYDKATTSLIAKLGLPPATRAARQFFALAPNLG